MFLYGIGIQYGRQFFAGLSGPGLKWNLLAAVGVLGSLAVALALGAAAGVSPAYSMGLFAGSLTSTPTLQAAIDAAGNRDPAIGYSVAYPFGVIGPILCLFAFSRLFKPRLAPAPAPLQPLEITLDDTDGATVAELMATLPPGVELVAIRQGGANKLPDPQARLAAGDGVLLFGQPDALEKARLALGRVDPGRIGEGPGRSGRRAGVRVAAGSRRHAARAGARFPDGIVAKIAEVRRGDAVLFPAPDLVLEYGDRVARDRAPRGDPRPAQALRRLDEVDRGVLLRLGRPGHVARRAARSGRRSRSRASAPSRSGLAGGPLIVSLILGRLGRTGSLSWHIPLVGEPHAAQLRADAVPRRGRPRVGRALRGHRCAGRASRSSRSARRSCSAPS